MSDYKSIITNIGLAKLADATANGNAVNLTALAVGDGNGSAVTPDATMTGLVNEVWRGSVNSITTDTDNPSHLKIECIIPTDVGGWWMREVGVFDDAGDLIIIANYPDTHKTLLTDGAAAEFRMMVIAEFTNTAAVTLQIDPAVVMASKQYVDQAVAGVDLSGEIEAHNLDADPHPNFKTPYDISFLAGVAGNGEGEDLREQEYGRWLAPRDLTISGVRANLEVPSTGSAVQVAILKNGAAFWSGSLNEGASALDDAVADKTVAAGDVLIFVVNEVGATIAGQKLTLTLKGQA